MPAPVGVALPLAPSTREAILRNRVFQGRVALPGRQLDMKVLERGWLLLRPRQQQTLALLYSIPDVPLTCEQAAFQLGITASSARRYEQAAVRILRAYLADPDAWAGMLPAARALLLRNGIKGPQQLTRRVVLDLSGGDLDWCDWGPRHSFALNQRLVELGLEPLEKRLPGGYAETTPMAAWRLGIGFAPTPANIALATANPALAAAFGTGAHRPNQDMVRQAWDCLTYHQQTVMVALYAGGHGPGRISTMQTAELLRLDTRTVERHHRAALARMATFFAEMDQGAATAF